MLTQNPHSYLTQLNKYSSAYEIRHCYGSNDIFISFIKPIQFIEYPETIEYGSMNRYLVEYNAGRMSPGNMFRSPCPEDPVFYYCDWKTFQIMMENRVIDDDILETAPLNILRKIYSSLSDDDKRFARFQYSMRITVPMKPSSRWDYVAGHLQSMANCLQFIDY